MDLSSYSSKKITNTVGFRLVNSKFPPINLFDDVADADEFEAVCAIQELTNPRILNELGNLNCLPIAEIPFGIDGCNYATSPFTHVNSDGSRFSNGDYGLLYLADTIDTAIKETVYHQERYFKNITGLHYDTIIMRGLKFTFSCTALDIKAADENIYHPDDYTFSRLLGRQALKDKVEALEYCSVRSAGQTCWALYTPKNVQKVIQAKHYEYVWDGQKISKVNQLKNIDLG